MNDRFSYRRQHARKCVHFVVQAHVYYARAKCVLGLYVKLHTNFFGKQSYIVAQLCYLCAQLTRDLLAIAKLFVRWSQRFYFWLYIAKPFFTRTNNFAIYQSAFCCVIFPKQKSLSSFCSTSIIASAALLRTQLLRIIIANARIDRDARRWTVYIVQRRWHEWIKLVSTSKLAHSTAVID